MAKRECNLLTNWQVVSFQRLLQKAGLGGNKKYSSHTAIRRNPVILLEALMDDAHHVSRFSSLVTKVCHTDVFISWDEAVCTFRPSGPSVPFIFDLIPSHLSSSL